MVVAGSLASDQWPPCAPHSCHSAGWFTGLAGRGLKTGNCAGQERPGVLGRDGKGGLKTGEAGTGRPGHWPKMERGHSSNSSRVVDSSKARSGYRDQSLK